MQEDKLPVLEAPEQVPFPPEEIKASGSFTFASLGGSAE